MRHKILFITSAFVVAVLLFAFGESGSTTASINISAYKKKNLISCGPDWEALKETLEENEIPPIPGAGNYKWKITTTSDSAQFYFNQGINMYYSFHIIEAMASFKKAVKFDPSAAMLHWAQALAYGPNINDLGYAASPDALTTSNRATELSSSCTGKEKMLIAAQSIRYSPDSTASRETLNQLYVDKMKEAYKKYPNDADVAALYADALMLQHPWDLWKTDGTPKPWTPLIRTVLEKLLAKTPNHPGANHYYIHVMEPSPYFAKALPSADRLGKLTPGLSHTVHMPSHIYLRSGHYAKGIAVNESAVKSYKRIIPLFSAVTGSDFLYLIHNLHMQTNNAIMGAARDYAARSAMETVNSINPDYLGLQGAMGNYIQYIYMTPVLVDVRFSNWSGLLLQPQPDQKMIYANIIYHFGRGMALSNQLRLAEAKHELERIEQLMADSSLMIPFSPFSAAIEGATVAEHLLEGTIALRENRVNDAIDKFRLAAETEEKMIYNEPRDWMLNPKPYLGNAYLKAGRNPEARKIFEKDLWGNNDNAWSLRGLEIALVGEKKMIEANKVRERFFKAYGDLKIVL